LHRLSAQQRESAVKLAHIFQRHHVALPYLGAFPMDFTNINFIGLDYAVPLLVKDEQQAVAELERDLDRLTDTEARGVVQELLREKRQLLKELEALATGLPATTLR
jgi:rubrerythrin